MEPNCVEDGGKITARGWVDELGEVLPEALVGCMQMCLSNVVPADFFIATFGRIKYELLKRGEASLAEAASQVAVDALCAQAFKGADFDELELMQIAAMDMIMDLADAAPFKSGDALISSIEDVAPSTLSKGRETVAVATKVADAVNAIYWDPVIRLVDVLVEVVGKKKEEEYRSALNEWRKRSEEKQNALRAAQKAAREAEKERGAAADDLLELEKQLFRAKKEKKIRASVRTLYDEAKCAQGNIAPAIEKLDAVLSDREKIAQALSKLEGELSTLGMFALAKKKDIRNEIKGLEEKLKAFDSSIKKLEEQIKTRKEKAAKLPELELELAKLSEFELKIRQAKTCVDQLDRRQEEARYAVKKAENELCACNSTKPKACDYSPESAKRPLRWRPKVPAFKTSASGGVGAAAANRQNVKTPKTASASRSSAGKSGLSSGYSSYTSSFGARARESADSAVSLIKKMCDVDLEYGPAGIAQIEMVLGLVHDQRGRLGWDDDTLWGLANVTGCFLGECMLLSGFSELGFQWDAESDGELVLANQTNKDGFNLGAIRPVTKCYKRLLNGPEDGVVHYYSMCMAMAQM